MRDATFTGQVVELGGLGAPDVDRSGPVLLPRLVLWLLVAAFVAVGVLLLVFAPRMIGERAPEQPRITAGRVTFVPAPGWTPAPSSSAAPMDAVTVAKAGATYTVWTQTGDDATTVARVVAQEVFPEAESRSAYFVQQESGVVKIRPRQAEGSTQISLVVVGPVDAGGPGFTRERGHYPGLLTVQVATGPAPEQGVPWSALLGDVDNMSSTVRPLATASPMENR